jgi:hypothetical protein
MNAAKQSRLRRVLQRMARSIVQHVPNDLDACEICRKTECTQDEWIVCEDRIAHAKCLEEIDNKKATE